MFVSDDAVASTIEHFLIASESTGVEITAYCCMPDHVHILVEGQTEDADTLKFVSVGKQASGYEYSRKNGTRLWQPSFFDHLLREEESSADVIRYILENPVRAGLVTDSDEYPFIGSSRWSRSDLRRALEIERPRWEPSWQP